jgi:hypothetical protein
MEHVENSRDKVDRIIRRSCLSKKSFSKEGADKIVDKLAFKNEEIYYYKCDFCSSYHLTSRIPNIPKILSIL